ncbi:hypothetical protein [Aeromonas salmonicida]|jgi:hypothetical protein|uniref:Uncharacterized protein n=1 Tax=Aeromonas salmonicida TaxID=645 RepID=A0AAX3VVH2_AERSA|nr:hypothetical protein [Aeromonas salmonicida]QYH27415.1 hypothetical protein G9H43_18725 [Aeromonas salmonicida subsp. masoucida]QYH31704.1 hypothetical protein G9457_18845 [Aeromonas salmonicida subsp. masoucida]WHF36819.1 hypothetical protein QLQ87_00175 [Aeromonas salmonicida]
MQETSISTILEDMYFIAGKITDDNRPEPLGRLESTLRHLIVLAIQTLDAQHKSHTIH